jgi:hypothetical protein
MPTNVLYVVFHGLICLVDGRFKGKTDQGFRAYVLVDKDGTHQVMYGDFLAEQDLLPSTKVINLNFNGLKAGTDTSITLDRSQNPVVNLTDFPPATDPSEVLAVVSLPRPNRIVNLFRGNIADGTLTDHGLFNPPPSQISAVRVFEYRYFDDPANVFLQDDKGNKLWKCPDLAAVVDNAGLPINVAVFHLYNEPPLQLTNPTPNDHNVHEFNNSMIFLGAKAISLSGAAHANESTRSPKDVPGILESEIGALDDRNQRVLVELVKALRNPTSGISLGGAGGTQVCGGGNASL